MGTPEIVKNYILDAIRKHPIKDKGITYKREIIYANGNDGTDFDWNMNDRTCEFCVVYDTKSGMNYIQVFVTKEGYIKGYYFEHDNQAYGEYLEPLYIGENKAKQFKKDLEHFFDDLGMWDKVFWSFN